MGENLLLLILLYSRLERISYAQLSSPAGEQVGIDIRSVHSIDQVLFSLVKGEGRIRTLGNRGYGIRILIGYVIGPARLVVDQVIDIKHIQRELQPVLTNNNVFREFQVEVIFPGCTVAVLGDHLSFMF